MAVASSRFDSDGCLREALEYNARRSGPVSSVRDASRRRDFLSCQRIKRSATLKCRQIASRSEGLRRRPRPVKQALVFERSALYERKCDHSKCIPLKGHRAMPRIPTTEDRRLEEGRTHKKYWKRWGPYLSERQWG